MGAESWTYYVPYQENLEQAFQDLRQRVMDTGDYEIPENYKDAPLPQTIEEVWRRCAEEGAGTYSILDMASLSTDPNATETGLVQPLSSQDLRELFGGEKPTRAEVEATFEEGWFWDKVRTNWGGLYVIIYQNNDPYELVFAGFSGDV